MLWLNFDGYIHNTWRDIVTCSCSKVVLLVSTIGAN
jgi:hypothetical protein